MGDTKYMMHVTIKEAQRQIEDLLTLRRDAALEIERLTRLIESTRTDEPDACNVVDNELLDATQVMKEAA